MKVSAGTWYEEQLKAWQAVCEHVFLRITWNDLYGELHPDQKCTSCGIRAGDMPERAPIDSSPVEHHPV